MSDKTYPLYEITYLLPTPVVQAKHLIPQDEFIEIYKPAIKIVEFYKSMLATKKTIEPDFQKEVDASLIILKDLPDSYFTTKSPLGLSMQNGILETKIGWNTYHTNVKIELIK